MIYFLHGEDSYRLKEKLNEIISGYKKVHKSGLNLALFDAKASDFKDFSDGLRVAPMFSEKKLVVLRNVFSDAKFQEDFLKELKFFQGAKDIIIICQEEKVDQRNKLFKTLLKDAKCQEFNFLERTLLRKWLKLQINKVGAKMNPDAEERLLAFVGNNLWQLASEMKKLADYKKGGLIKKEDVLMLVRPKIETDIFKTIDALSGNDKKQALDFLHKHIEQGDSPLYLLSMIGYQFRNLLIIKELADRRLPYESVVKKSGLHPFVVKKNYYLCSQFSMAQLKKIYQKIFQADSDIKTGKIEPELALDLLVAGI